MTVAGGERFERPRPVPVHAAGRGLDPRRAPRERPTFRPSDQL